MSVAKRLGAAMLAVICLMFVAVSFSQTASAYPEGTNPAITLDHNQGPRGDSVKVTGTGFTPGTADLTFNSASVSLGSVTVDSAGNFVKTITVPGTVALGAHTVEASEAAHGEDATAPFTVIAGGTGGTGGGLANTGVAVVGIAALGLVLLVGGGLMLMAGRRRKVAA